MNDLDFEAESLDLDADSHYHSPTSLPSRSSRPTHHSFLTVERCDTERDLIDPFRDVLPQRPGGTLS